MATIRFPWLRFNKTVSDTAEANITCEEGDLIRHNHNCTPVCEDGFTASIDAILCEDGRAVCYPCGNGNPAGTLFYEWFVYVCLFHSMTCALTPTFTTFNIRLFDHL